MDSIEEPARLSTIVVLALFWEVQIADLNSHLVSEHF
jgi:hypothetical protein